MAKSEKPIMHETNIPWRSIALVIDSLDKRFGEIGKVIPYPEDLRFITGGVRV